MADGSAPREPAAAWRRAAAAFVLGALATLALPPFHLVAVLIASFAGLVWIADGCRRARGAFAVGWWFGLGHFLAGLYWVGIAFGVAGVAPWAAPFAVFALAAASALFPALAVLAAHPSRGRGAVHLVVFATAWTAGEWLRGFAVLGGFPWNLVGYAWMASEATIQFAALFGVFGLSWVTVLAAAAPVELLRPRPNWRPLALSWTALAVISAAGALRLAGAEPATVPEVRLRLVQANIAQYHKWQESLRAAHLRKHLELTTRPAAAAPTHVIWPETAAPYLLAGEPEVRAALAAAVPAGGVLLTGAVRVSSDEQGGVQAWNSVHAIDGAGAIVATYDKFHLVPFGEYTPLRSLLRLAKLTPGETDFSRGPGPRTLSVPGLPPFSPLICYEAIFPGQVSDPDQRPEWLLNLTNDAWYGISTGPYQHFEQARLRAVEEGLALVRVANTGITGVVDPYGRVTARLGLAETGIVDAALPAPLQTRPPYGVWRDWPLAGLFVLCLFLTMRRRARPARTANKAAARRSR
jgi:apolipoprotein N-acyltransferase